jgi:ankyrin repeat protein
LFIAARSNATSIIELLLQKGANMDIIDKQGNTALSTATMCHNKEAVETLLKHGADRNIQSPDGKTARELALSCGHIDLVELFNSAKLTTDDGNQSSSSASDNFAGPEYAEIRRVREGIIQKLKAGGKYQMNSSEGHGELIYENESYIYRYVEHMSDYSYETMYKNDEDVLKYMFNHFKYFDTKSDLAIYEKVSSNIK